MLKEKESNKSNPVEISKFTDCPKWRKNKEFSSIKANAMLWDGYTSAKPAKKLSSLLESMKEDHPGEYNRLALDTLKNENFMKKIRNKEDSDYEEEEAQKIVEKCLYKLETWYGKTKLESIAETYRTYKNLNQNDDETIIDFIRKFEETNMKLINENVQVPDILSAIDLLEKR